MVAGHLLPLSGAHLKRMSVNGMMRLVGLKQTAIFNSVIHGGQMERRYLERTPSTSLPNGKNRSALGDGYLCTVMTMATSLVITTRTEKRQTARQAIRALDSPASR